MFACMTLEMSVQKITADCVQYYGGLHRYHPLTIFCRARNNCIFILESTSNIFFVQNPISRI